MKIPENALTEKMPTLEFFIKQLRRALHLEESPFR